MTATPTPQRTVLIVDDEPFIRMNAVDVLSDAGFGVLEAANADEALLMIGKHPEIQLLFTDINMPGTMDGLELARRVHELRHDVHLIITSGKVRLKDEDIPNAGAFIGKPYRDKQVVALVTAAFAA